MFEKEPTPVNAFLWHPRDTHRRGTSPCPCCSPALAALHGLMTVSDAELASPGYWRVRGGDAPPAYTGTRVFLNAKILTMDDAGSETDAMAIKAGRILALGDAARAMAASDEDVDIVDCDSRCILPGFIEPHMHFLPVASLNRFENIGPFRFETVDAALRRLAEIAQATPAGEWIVARQFDPSLQEGPDALTRDMLDAVSTEHVLFVYNASLHFAYCNSKALQIAGITRDTPDPDGARYGRDAAGEPNGVLEEARAMASVGRHNTAMAGFDLAGACLEVCARANALGITTLCDQATGMSRGVGEVDLYRALAASGNMTTRLRYSVSFVLGEQWDKAGIGCDDGDEMVRSVGWKIVSDGSNQGLTGLQRQPYLNSESRGEVYLEADRLTEMVADRASRGWALVIHANGDKAIDNALDAFEAAAGKGLLTNAPWRIEHCSILHDEQIARMARLGISPSFLIGHVYYWGKAMRDSIFGKRKAQLLDRTAACEAAGIRWSLHSDDPVTEMSPLRCIQNAVTRKLWKAPGELLAPEECISVDAALRAMTRDAAWQCHSDHEIGSLEVGKLADFVLLQDDPRRVSPDDIGSVAVLETWLGGRRVYAANPR